jgi:sigma-E factor negative regulatory protein RseA
MSTGSETQTTLAEDLSALVDGELHEAGVSLACGRWRSEVSSRSTWHAYQLIGDVLRSEDLASDAARDAAFLSALRGRLAAEPTILAPQPIDPLAGQASTGSSAQVRRRRWSWAAPSAVAAGFVAVAGVLVVTRNPGPPVGVQTAAGPSAAAEVGAATRPVGASVAPLAEPQSLIATGQVIRDAGLDRYLAAHKHFAGSAALGVPSALLRNATVDAAGR